MSRLTADSKQVSLLSLAGRTVAALSLTFLLVGCGGVQSPDTSNEQDKPAQTESQQDENEEPVFESVLNPEINDELNKKDSVSPDDEDTEVSAL